MKKMIIVLSLFTVLIGFCVAESIVHNKIYTRMHENLKKIDAQIEADKDNLSDSLAMPLMQDTAAYWKKRKNLLMSFSNHALLRTADEHLTRLEGYIAVGEYKEASVHSKVAVVFFHDLLDDLSPRPTNIF